MKAKVFHLKNLKKQDYGRIKVVDLLATKEYPKLSVAWVKRIEDGKMGYDTKSDTAYYVLEGNGISTINGKRHRISKGDLVFIPKGTKYKNSKGLTFLAISYPRFNMKYQISVE